MRLHAALPDYFADRHSALRSKATRRKVQLAIDLLDKHTGGKQLDKITGEDVVEFLASRPWASATVANYRSLLVSFFDWASWKGLTKQNPSATVRHLVKVKVQPVRTHNWLEPDEAALVVAACLDGTLFGKRDLTLIRLGMETGLRAAELAGLRWGKVDMNARAITVVGKGGKLAQVGIPAKAFEALFEWRSECAKGLGRPVGGEDPVFPRGYRNFDGTSCLAWSSAGSVYLPREVVKKRGEMAGFPSLRPHDLRRSFCAWMEDRFDLLTASEHMRHSNVGTTQSYLKGNPKKVIERGKNLDFGF